jgi:hypothetical protein
MLNGSSMILADTLTSIDIDLLQVLLLHRRIDGARRSLRGSTRREE